MHALPEDERIQFCPTENISLTHWSIDCDPDFFVQTITMNGCHILIKINPTDRRGYRLIIQLWGKKDIKSTLNRPWTESEMDSVFRAASMISRYYYSKGLIPQIVFAGNNSMEREGEVIVIGKNEPAMMHVHIFGRGLIEKEYIFGIPLGGPEIGKEFNLVGQGDEKGQAKVPWSSEQRRSFLSDLRKWLDKW